MTENGNPVSRAELAAHIKGIDEHFDGIEADLAEVKWGIMGIVDELRRMRKEPRERMRAWGPPLVSASVAACVSFIVVFIH